MNTTTNALTEMYNSFGGGNVLCDKAHMEHVTAVINTLEKKKIKYKIIPMPVYGDDGLEVTFAIVIMVDKKNLKRNKKSISNNKYILFNSWYTKNRKSSWPNSHTMWNLMKTHTTAKPFVDIFDFMEKIGKSIETKKSSPPPSSSPSEDNAVITDVNNENNARRMNLYNEFYKITTYTFVNDAAPSNSFIYDIKLDGNDGLEKLNRQTLENGVIAFKNILKSAVPSSVEFLTTTTATTTVATSKKNDKTLKSSSSSSSSLSSSSRKRSATTAAVSSSKNVKSAKKSKKSHVVPALTMENDQSDDTQMSYS
uniref:39K/PP31 n=1 Tax=Spodoptera frugiperda nuclear polyhedrosis virus TaxID=10455 RepID=A0A7G3W7H7_NPVSF|nr:39K/PP31 [Spodoptera frugiperda multiple nucleopolyhedrovirus]